ncbi:MAG: DUF4446 family protein [Ignavibacteriales bacterium]
MTELTALLNDKVVWFQLLLIITFFILCVVIWQRTRYYKRLVKYYSTLMGSYQGGNLETILKQITENEKEVKSKLDSIASRIDVVEKQMPYRISQVAMLRYKAFPDIGGDMSFSLAALSERGDGFVITSIHGRSDTRVYGKAIENYSSDHQLSDEEREAIAKAKKMGD